MHKHWYLQQIDLFKGIPDQEIKTMADQMVEKTCHKKELIYMPEEVSHAIYLLKKGEVTLYNSHRGKRLIIEVLRPGSIFGNITFASGKSTHFAEATEDSYICIFPVADFLKVLQAKPQIMLNFFTIMSEKIRLYEHRLKGGLFDAKEKIIQQLELKREEQNHGSLLSRLFPRKTRLTHERLAELTGLSRETVTRAINDLKKAGFRLPL